MKVLVTGATGFAGTWLVRELRSAGHLTVAAPPSAELDISDRDRVRALIRDAAPDAVAHLAAVSHAPAARADPARAFAVNEGGTRAVVEAVVAERPGIPVLISSTSEVYGAPAVEDLPLDESAPLRATHPYARSKLAQERVALEVAGAGRTPVVITRAFNHTGPGQRAEFVAPALAGRVLAARRLRDHAIRVGNLDVRRDFLDVRDVVRAYRLLLDGVADGSVVGGTIVNVASGTAVSIREILERLADVAGTRVEPIVDPDLVRPDDPPVIVGDAALLRDLTGWSPRIPLSQTLDDLVASVDRPVDARVESIPPG